MSRRRESYVPYRPITSDDLYTARYGTQARRTDRAHLRLLHAESQTPCEPLPWLSVVVAVLIGAALLPSIHLGASVLAWLAGGTW